MTTRLIPQTLAIGLLTLSLAACDRNPLPTAPDIQPLGPAQTFALDGVVEQADGNGVPGVDVTVLSLGSSDGLADYAGRSTVSDAAGHFGMTGLARGAWRVMLHKRGYADREFDVTIGSDVVLRFSLVPASATARAAARVF